jgi:hypothetical protein
MVKLYVALHKNFTTHTATGFPIRANFGVLMNAEVVSHGLKGKTSRKCLPFGHVTVSLRFA